MAKFKILCIDGGGIRGIIPAIWLKEIEKRLGKPIWNYVDLICGTSTGAILAAAVAKGIKIDSAIALYEDYGPKIFKKKNITYSTITDMLFKPRYSDTPLESVLKELFSIDAELNSFKRNVCITSYDIFNRKTFLMRSYSERTNQIKIWEACKASSSAPSYFPAHIMNYEDSRIPLIDGGVIANNPSCLALAEAIHIRKKDSIKHIDRDLVLLSLGTGSSTRPIDGEKAREFGPADWIGPIIDVLFDGSSDASDYMTRQILDDESYLRFQIDLYGASDDLDDASPKNINALKLVASAYLSDGDGEAKLEAACKLLGPSQEG